MKGREGKDAEGEKKIVLSLWMIRLLVILLAGFILICPVRARAAEPGVSEADTGLMEELDFSEIQQTVDDILDGDFEFESVVLDLITGKQVFTLESFLEALVQRIDGRLSMKYHPGSACAAGCRQLENGKENTSFHSGSGNCCLPVF